MALNDSTLLLGPVAARKCSIFKSWARFSGMHRFSFFSNLACSAWPVLTQRAVTSRPGARKIRFLSLLQSLRCVLGVLWVSLVLYIHHRKLCVIKDTELRPIIDSLTLFTSSMFIYSVPNNYFIHFFL